MTRGKMKAANGNVEWVPTKVIGTSSGWCIANDGGIVIRDDSGCMIYETGEIAANELFKYLNCKNKKDIERDVRVCHASIVVREVTARVIVRELTPKRRAKK